MEKKSNRALSRRRPPNLNLRGSSSSRNDVFEKQSFNREGEEVAVIQAAGPVFASVHRPRHASISAIRRDMNHPPHSQQSQPHILARSTLRPMPQQTGQSPEFLQIPERSGDNSGNSRTRASEPRKVGWEGHHNQSIAVPIPLPFRQQPQSGQSASQAPGMGHHPTHYGHLQQQQQQNAKQSSALAHNRIPVPQQNFNQISKTATNLLNDIYEKHLLSQTTFENVTMLNSRTLSGPPVGMLATGPFPESGGHHHHGMCPADGDFNLNNFQQKQQSIRGHHHHPYRSHHQHQPLANISNHHIQPQQQQSQQPGQGLLQVGVVQQDPNQHVYETVDGPLPSSHVTGAPGPIASSVPNRTQRRRPPGKVQRNGKNSATAAAAENKQSNPSNQKKHVSGGPDENYFGMGPTVQQPSNQHPPPPPPPAYNHQPRTRADGENDSGPSGGHKAHPVVCHPVVVQGSASSQSVPPFPLERIPTAGEAGDGIQNIRGAPIGSAAGQGDCEASESADHFPEFNGPGTVAKFQYRNSKIDLMLETAQAMAAAAYYAK